MATWAVVKVGDGVEDKDGVEWTITHRAGRTVTIKRKDDSKIHTLTPDPDASVTISSRPEPPTSMEQVVDTVATHLGGQVIANTDANGMVTVPLVKDMSDSGVLLAHLYAMHGDSGSSDLTPRERTTLHAMGHDKGEHCVDYVPHLHVAGFYR